MRTPRPAGRCVSLDLPWVEVHHAALAAMSPVVELAQDVRAAFGDDVPVGLRLRGGGTLLHGLDLRLQRVAEGPRSAP